MSSMSEERARPVRHTPKSSRSHSFPPTQLFIALLTVACAYILYSAYDKESSDSASKMPPKAPLNPRNFPRPPLLEKTPRHLQIKWDGVTIADTKDAYWVLETTHPPSR